VTGVLEDPPSPRSLTVRIWGLNCLWARARAHAQGFHRQDKSLLLQQAGTSTTPATPELKRSAAYKVPRLQIGAHSTHPPAFAEVLLGSQVVCCSLLELGLNITWSQWTSTHQRPIHRMPIIMQLWMNLNLVNIWFLLCSQFFNKIGLTYRYIGRKID
jgi:hypothetical protein